MRARLKQQVTTCYGFPLALQLMDFKAIPALIEKILELDNTATFLQEPDRCNTTNTLLHFESMHQVEVDTEAHFIEFLLQAITKLDVLFSILLPCGNPTRLMSRFLSLMMVGSEVGRKSGRPQS